MAEGSDRLEFREREEPPPRQDGALLDPETRARLEHEETARRLSALERDNERMRRQLEERQLATRKAIRAWSLAKGVISERFGAQAGNLIRQGIEVQVEREFGAGPAEEPRGTVAEPPLSTS